MIPSNLHTHTTASDGVNTAEELIRAAIGKGFMSLGFSEHAPSDYDMGECIKSEALPAYNAEIARLKGVYAPKIQVYLGTECDMYTPLDKAGLDYTIGSLHGVLDRETGAYCCVDYSPEMLAEGIRGIGGGDPLVLIEKYLDELVRLTESYRPDILGHLDLFTKFNGASGNKGVFFDENGGGYKKLVECAVQGIAGRVRAVEVNTGAMSRGFRQTPYPSGYALAALRDAGVPVTVSSDAHSAQNLDYGFGLAVDTLKKAGYKSVVILKDGAFTDFEI